MTAAIRQEQLAAIFKAATVIPVLTIERPEHAVPLARALVAGGVRVLEVTLRTPVAIEDANIWVGSASVRSCRGQDVTQACFQSA